MSSGANAASTRTIVEVETDNGILGLGDASYAHAAGIIERDFAPALRGLDLRLGTAALKRYCLPDHLDFGTPLLKVRLAAWGGLDIAIWDILAQEAKVPLYRFLDGPIRDCAEFVAYSYSVAHTEDAPAKMAAIAHEAIARTGARIFEFKVGVHPLEIDIATVKAVHERLAGRAQISIDANMAWTLQDARQLLKSVGPLLENAEEPVASLRDMQQLATECGVAVSTHCSDVDTMLAYPRVGVVPTLDAVGGISGLLRLKNRLAADDRRIWLRSHAESGIGFAAIVHLGMALAALNRPAQSLMDLIAEDLVAGAPWDVSGGGVRAPALPGLGVALDRAALANCRQHYLTYGEILAFPPALRSKNLTERSQ